MHTFGGGLCGQDTHDTAPCTGAVIPGIPRIAMIRGIPRMRDAGRIFAERSKFESVFEDYLGVTSGENSSLM